MSDKPVRQEVLEEAIRLTCGDRNRDYGDPRPNFEATAAMWSAYKGVEFQAHDVAAMMILLKLARVSESPWKVDNWTDAGGYAGLGAEVAPPVPEVLPPAPAPPAVVTPDPETLGGFQRLDLKDINDALEITMQPLSSPPSGPMCNK